MSGPSPPIASPGLPPDPSDTPTDPGLRVILDRHEAEQLRRIKVEYERLMQLNSLEQENGLAAVKTQLTVRNLVWAGGVIVSVFIGGIIFTSQALAAAKKAGRDAGTDVVKDVVREQKYQREDLTRQEKKIDRVQEQLELVLNKLKVPPSARPDPVPEPDGGRPK